MLHGKTADAVARANTAILMQLIEQLIDLRLLTKAAAIAMLGEAADKMASGPNATSGTVMDDVQIIRKELVPRL
jgi:hypothetical protein